MEHAARAAGNGLPDVALEFEWLSAARGQPGLRRRRGIANTRRKGHRVYDRDG
jgi:hypothetical protein